MIGKLDLNDLVRSFSLLLSISLPAVFFYFGENRYVDSGTIALSILMCLFLVVALTVEKDRTNPFIVLGALYFLLFYILRVVTLNIEPYTRGMNLVSERDFSDVNRTLLFMLCAIFFLFLGLFTNRISKIPAVIHEYRCASRFGVMVLVVITMLVLYLYRLTVSFNGSEVLGYYLRVFSPNSVMLLFLVFYFVTNKFSRSHEKKIFLFYVAAAFIVLITLVGGRKTLLVLILTMGVILYVLHNRLFLSIKGLLLIISVGVISFVLYDLSTFLRWTRYSQLYLDGQSLNYFQILETYLSKGFFQTEGLVKIFDRLGFLDYEVDSMASAELYRKAVNPIYYGKSIIDNVSPGLSFFDTLKAGQAKIFLQYFGYIPTYDDYKNIKYTSQMFGGVSELYIFFYGYYSLPFFYVAGFLFSYIYSRINFNDIYYLVLWRSFILLSFVSGAGFLESFGFDWYVVASAYMLVAFLITYPIFKNKGREVS